MADIKRQALLPKGDENGLYDIAETLANEGARRIPARPRAALVIYDARRITIDSDSGEEVVTIRIRRIETILPQDLAEAEKYIRRALEARSGEEVLPLELEDDIRRAFGEMKDPGSGVDPDNPDDPGNQNRKGK